MDNNENMEKNNNSKMSRETLIRVVVISVLIVFLIMGIYKSISKNLEEEQLKVEKQELQIEAEKTYKQRVSEYLEEKYDEEFEIELIEKGYKEKTYGSGDLTLYTGKDDNTTEEYLYSCSPNHNSDIKCLIKYWKKIEDDTYEIFEYLCTYEKALEFYNQKMEIQQELKSYLGDEYTIDMFSRYDHIYPMSDSNLEEIIRNGANEYTNLYNNLSDLISDKNISIIIKYKDTNVVIGRKKSVDEIFKLIETE